MDTNKLEKLYSLLQSGAITQKEFDTEKAKLLSNIKIKTKEKTKKESKESCFDKFGENASVKYYLTTSIGAIISFVEVIGFLVLFLSSNTFIFKYATIYTIFFGCLLVLDYFLLRNILAERISKINKNFIISLCLLLIPIVGFIPARHLWIYSREKELIPDYRKFEEKYDEEKTESIITTGYWKYFVFFEEVYAVGKFLEILPYIL